ncbi:hypothetical protein M0P65_04435 [Candidatus Gracilibacteria bacterium]|nr:hypothetical protein [Candidatus Gracilibacteria bacterium]
MPNGDVINFDQIFPFFKILEKAKDLGLKKEYLDNIESKRNELINNFKSKYQIKGNSYTKFSFTNGFRMPEKNKLKDLENISGEFTNKIETEFYNINDQSLKKLKVVQQKILEEITTYCNTNKINNKLKSFFEDLIKLIFEIIKTILSYIQTNKKLDMNTTISDRKIGDIIKNFSLFQVALGLIIIVAFLYFLIKGETLATVFSLIIGIISIGFTNDLKKISNKVENLDIKLDTKLDTMEHVVERGFIIQAFDFGKISKDVADERLKTLDIKYKK